ncbi:hypothetical protein M422DRAFT_255050 [Sphaerobolus stellatus SS14]|uniref:Unplaced genomic scaffold SPHSTscaffold_58, whole genome shotgun sequence n=1 Tax=Sphaerobolus stellatus (strain SS14) TaxID=990650 RepID=A0A0C9UG66_SPHS4|nr:hypothetical protein M422DRAFT_255050 [Sphaerobolus stellatus SS14]
MRAALSVLSLALLANAGVTIYTQVTFGTGAATATGSAFPSVTNAAAFDPTMLIPPPPPNPAVGGANVVQLLTGAMANMSAPVQSGFLGFSIELSVADQVCEWTNFSYND